MRHNDRRIMQSHDAARTLTRRGWIGQTGAAALGFSVALECGSIVRPARAAADSSKGSKLLVAGNIREQETLRGLFVVEPVAGTWRRLVEGNVIGGRISPDGGTVAFRRTVRGDNGASVQSVWLCDVDTGAGLRKLAEPAFAALWSADGKELLVSSILKPQAREYDAKLMRPDGSHARKLSLPDHQRALDWSADGEWLLTLEEQVDLGAGNAQREPNIYARKLDGSSATLLVENFRHPAARFAPDSQRVSLLRPENDKPEPLSLWVGSRDGTGMHKLVAGKPELFPYDHCWSPDGKQIAVDMVQIDRPGQETLTSARGQIQVFNDEGRLIRKIELPHERAQVLDWR